MIFNQVLIFCVALVVVVRGAMLATKYATRLASGFRLSEYTVGFLVVAIISILPETFIAVNSALKGVPSFGLGTLFGSNVADLTLVFFVIILFAGRNIKIESRILKNNRLYPVLLLIPIALGLNGHYSRMEGVALVLVGVVFYYSAFRNDGGEAKRRAVGSKLINALWLLVGMAILLVSSHFIVTSATTLAGLFGISSVLIGMFVVALGTTIPELIFSFESVERRDDGLAVGDILGTVLADATVVLGILAVIDPFFFPQRIVYVAGLFMVGASILLLRLMYSGRAITQKEAYLLLAYWIFFVFVEFAVNTYIPF